MRAGATGGTCLQSLAERNPVESGPVSQPAACDQDLGIAEAHDARVVPDNPLSSIQCGFTLS